MIKKDISFLNYNGDQVTKTFYFNYTRLEGVEIELEHGDLEETIQMLNETEDAKKAYSLFKEVIVGAVGVKSADGNQFDKSPEVKAAFTNSPAMSVLIWSFIEDPASAASFLEGMLPPDAVAAGRARVERQNLEEALAAQNQPKDHQQTPAPVAPEPVVEAPAMRSDEEIMSSHTENLTNEELARLIEIRKAAQV